VARILIAGCGYVGSTLAGALLRDGHAVWGLRRRAAGLPEGVQPIEADLGFDAGLEALPGGLDTVFYLVAPGGRDDALYRIAYVDGLSRLLRALKVQGQRPRRIFLASSTGVYGQSHGEWVDERSRTEPREATARRILEGERLLADGPYASCAVRFGGIYGPRRTGLVERVRTGRAVYREGEPHYTNRIHRDDCAGVLRHLLGVATPEPLYVAVDSEPAEELEVMRWLAGALGAPPPRPARAGELPPARSNKRCRNDRLLSSGYHLRYPTFREGYTALLAAA
jgi:nucleoside-diphosphate-sugar epimerase